MITLIMKITTCTIIIVNSKHYLHKSIRPLRCCGTWKSKVHLQLSFHPLTSHVLCPGRYEEEYFERLCPTTAVSVVYVIGTSVEG